MSADRVAKTHPQTHNCPACGAAVAQRSTHCRYCGALLKTVACPSCFAMMFAGAKFCPHCGATAAPIQQQGTVAHLCPHCSGAPLKAIEAGGVAMGQCASCGGLWLGSEAFQQICTDREKQSAAMGVDSPASTAARQDVRYRKCPLCGRLMNRKHYAHRSGVIVDVCRPHGVWLDADELRRIIEFIRSGGLDRAREAQKEEIERQQRQLEALRYARTSGDLDAGPYGGSESEAAGGLAGVLRWLFS
jgi:Zn-finger nucleic acid-binding protein